jgi:8-oxo-dGTP diphosphatase
MKTITIGEKFDDCKFDFRETCFGMCEKDGKMLLVKQNGDFSFIGGGIEENETHEECLKREFIEESGYEILDVKPFVTIDCFWLAAGKWPMESLAHYDIVKVGNKICEPTEAGHEPQIVGIDEVFNLLSLPYHKKALECFLKDYQS